MSIPLLSLREDIGRLAPRWLQHEPAPGLPRPQSKARPGAWLARTKALLLLLLPSFVLGRLQPAKPRRLHPTSWLDGLRGFAALSVVLWHFTVDHFGGGWYIWPYGLQPAEDTVPSSPLQLPFLRAVYAGPAMVHVFFVISGYALSLKPLMHIRKRDYDGLQRTVASSIFRRGLRLFLPAAALTFIITILVRLGGPFELFPVQRHPTLHEQLQDWLDALWKITYSWDWEHYGVYPPYDTNLWTLSMEYCESLLLFSVIMGLSRLKTYCRLSLLLGIMVYCIRCGHWGAFEFLAGMGLAEIGVVQGERPARGSGGYDEALAYSLSDSPSRSARSCLATLFFLANLLSSLFLVGWPAAGADQAPIISTLWRITIEPFLATGDGNRISHFWFAIASTQMVLAIQQVHLLQGLFTTPLAQYLGDISYSIYLIHGSLLRLLMPRCMPFLWTIVGGVEEAGMWGRMLIWFLGLTAVAIPSVWIADLFLRAIDRKSVIFARWVESLCLE